MNNRILRLLTCLLFLGWHECSGQAYHALYLSDSNIGLVRDVAFSPTDDDGAIITSINDGTCFIIRQDAQGVVQWAKSVTLDNGAPFWRVYGVQEIDGGPAFYVTCASMNPIPGGYPYIIILEFDANLQLVLANYYHNIHGICMGGALANHDAEAYRDASGGYTLVLPDASNFTCMYGVDQFGDTLYTRLLSALPGASGSINGFESLQLNDGTTLFLNNASSDFNLMRAQNGSIIWSKTWQTPDPYDQARGAVQLPDDSIVVVGVHGLDEQTGEHWGFLLKMDPSGNIGWHRRFRVGQPNFIASGLPEEISLAPNGDLLVYLRYWNTDLLARFGPDGILHEVHALSDPNDPLPHYFKRLVPKYDANGWIRMAGSVEYFGAPDWRDSLFICKVQTLSDLTCGLDAWPHFDEPYPNATTVQNNGAVGWSEWFRYGDLTCTVTPASWATSTYCVGMGAPPARDWISGTTLAPSLLEKGEEARLTGGDRAFTSVAVHDAQGRWVAEGEQGDDHWTIGTSTLKSGLYSVTCFDKLEMVQTLRMCVVE